MSTSRKAGHIDRRVREEWEMDGSTDLYTRCNEKAKELVENHKVEPLPSDVVDADPRHRRQGREGRGSRLRPGSAANHDVKDTGSYGRL